VKCIPVSVICEFYESGDGKRGNRFVMQVDVVWWELLGMEMM